MHSAVGPGELPNACIICGDILGDDTSYRQLPCSHIFHKPCIDTWLRSQDASCPICRCTFYHLRMPRLMRIASPSASSPTSSPGISHLKLMVSWLGKRISMRKKNTWFWHWYEDTLLSKGSCQAMINRSSRDTKLLSCGPDGLESLNRTLPWFCDLWSAFRDVIAARSAHPVVSGSSGMSSCPFIHITWHILLMAGLRLEAIIESWSATLVTRWL